jgi:hypothetical protein
MGKIKTKGDSVKCYGCGKEARLVYIKFSDFVCEVCEKKWNKLVSKLHSRKRTRRTLDGLIKELSHGKKKRED